ncbi:ABC transporter permease [Bradyrhizobium sp. CCGB12]|uniref:ABC transporter permease n=1 Tax=Bradyrhizobium sp. CCGB12 TaxID=2949632 RepID=UPI0020B4536A|nr:ABC transporter permease [Bradyrhizobium sp. CCGB12]MCP3392311.1 ABC transporter permease [Bradyrhizobium sp. CCGB12]
MFYDFLFDHYSRATIKLLADREIRSRIVGTYLGLGHYVVVPLLMLLIYSFVFSQIFTMSWPGAIGRYSDFVLRVFIGLIIFQFAAELFNRAPSLVLENPAYIKKVVFPLETLVPIAITVALFAAIVSFGVFLLGHVIIVGLPSAAIFWMPIILLPLILLTAGLGWALAALGVFLRDLRQLVGVLVSLLTFLSPIFYPLSAVPPAFRAVIALNPLTQIIEMTRSAIFDHQSPSFLPLLLLYAGTAAVAQIGYWGFMRTKKAFADVV